MFNDLLGRSRALLDATIQSGERQYFTRGPSANHDRQHRIKHKSAQRDKQITTLNQDQTQDFY